MSWIERYGEERLREVVASSISWSGALRALGLRTAGSNHKTIQRWVRLLEIDTSHFDANEARGRATRGRAAPLDEVLVEHSTYHRGHLKRRLYDTGLKPRSCELCGVGEEWQGKPMSLILDHVNGVHDDNRLENLRIVCPNCNATLDTHCGRNVPRERRCEGCGEPFAPTASNHRHCSMKCVGRTNGDRTRGVPQPHTRKVDRPPYETLLADVATMPMTAVGAKHGVSDNAVRKWLRWYEREHARTVRRAPAP